MHGLVRQHRARHEVADGEHVRQVGAHLLVDGNDAPVAHVDVRGFEIEALAIGAAAHGHQHAVEYIGAFAARVFELHREAFRLRRAARDLGVEQDLLVARLEALLERLHEVRIGARHQLAGELDHRELRAQRGIHRGHLEADDAAADDQQPLRHAAELQRAGGIDDARIVRDER